MLRTHCVYCNNELEVLFIRKNYPITASPPALKQKIEDDIVSDQIFCKCPSCSCIQLGSLIDPVVLYENAHNNTYNTPMWKEHHIRFCEFIIKTNRRDIIEIGGNGLLYKLMNEVSFKYSCLDICDPIEKLPNIEYHLGNCEEFNFTDDKTIVMSHVFEHLYNPRKFVENISISNIDSIYISIPNMPHLLETKNINILHNEHTYYIDKIYIEWLFSQYNYTLVDYYEFNNHSLFFNFKQTDVVNKYDITNRPKLAENINTILNSQVLRDVQIKPGSFVIPAGLFGQMLYHITNMNIAGFIDNDRMKQGFRVYGTPYVVFGFDEILRHDNITVYIFAGPYAKEIIKQLHGYSKHIEIIEL
jgi:hypothetical protein